MSRKRPIPDAKTVVRFDGCQPVTTPKSTPSNSSTAEEGSHLKIRLMSPLRSPPKTVRSEIAESGSDAPNNPLPFQVPQVIDGCEVSTVNCPPYLRSASRFLYYKGSCNHRNRFSSIRDHPKREHPYQPLESYCARASPLAVSPEDTVETDGALTRETNQRT